MTTSRATDAPAASPAGRTATEAMILAEACQLFAARGFDGTSIRDIASAVGISNAALYHYFADKDELLARIVISVIERQCAMMEERVSPHDNPSEKLRVFMQAYADFFEKNMAESIASSRSFSALEDPLQRERAIYWRDRYESMLRAIIREGMETGEFREGDVALTGRAVLSCLNWMYRWYSPTGELRPREIVEAYAEVLIGGIAAKPGRVKKSGRK